MIDLNPTLQDINEELPYDISKRDKEFHQNLQKYKSTQKIIEVLETWENHTNIIKNYKFDDDDIILAINKTKFESHFDKHFLNLYMSQPYNDEEYNSYHRVVKITSRM